jgi:3-deoxy-7-phosphoheptulonate synthase
MFKRTDDLRITETRPLLPPAILLEEIPSTERISHLVANTRQAIAEVIAGTDPRLVVIVGPCSIHDPTAALEYAEWLEQRARRYDGQLIVCMRSYFEKPRTSVGWKGLINDPDLDESYHINKGLRVARKLLLDVNALGVATASEFLDTQIPQFIADLTSWVAIGARTTESQVHRELASGLSMPVGFKNGTDGTTETAVDAVLSARSPHLFPSVTKQGVSAIFETTGNDTCHVILRGGHKTGPNYDAAHVDDVCAKLGSRGLRQSVMVDCSHANSGKHHLKQIDVARDVAGQVAEGSWRIFGVMIESHLVEGRQNYTPGRPATYGQSITDACLSIAQTEPLLELLAAAQLKRGARPESSAAPRSSEVASSE